MSHNNTEHAQKAERLNLTWVCGQTGRKHQAGVAFYNQDQGDYRLKIDVMPEDKTLYLKMASVSEGLTHYRVEAAVKKGGRISHRAEVGAGYSRDDDPSLIYMDIGPFSRTLVLEQSV